jgi:competence protein ComEC
MNPTAPIFRPLFAASVIASAGIIAGHRLHPPAALAFASAILLASAAWFLTASDHPRCSSLCLAFSIFSFGAGIISFDENTLPKNHLALSPPSEEVALIGKLSCPLEMSGEGFRIYLDVHGIDSGDGIVEERSGLVRIHVSDPEPLPEIVSKLTYGSWIRVETVLEEPQSYRNPGSFDQRNFLAGQGIYLTGFLRYTEFLQVLAPCPRFHPIAILHAFRQYLLGVLGSRVGVYFPSTFESWGINKNFMPALSRAILLGDRSGIEDELELDFKRSGLYHLIAISGGHMVVIAAIFYFIFKKMRLGYRWVNVASGLAICLYAFLAGGGPTVNRAALVVVLFFIGKALDRPVDLLNILGASAILLFLQNPRNLFDISFQLTYAATLGIVLLSPAIMKFFSFIPYKKFGQINAVSLGAQLGTAPFSAVNFNIMGGWAFLPYLPVIPLMSAVLGFGLAGLFAAPWPALSTLLLTVHGTLLALLSKIAQMTGSWPGVCLRMITPDTAEIVLYLAFLAALMIFPKKPKMKWSAVISLILLMGWHFGMRPLLRSDELEAHFLDVGNADCTLLRMPSGECILVDSGGAFDSTFDIGRWVVVRTLRSLGVDRIKIAVITHPHPDHQLGMFAVLDELHVGEIWAPDREFGDEDHRRIMELADQKRVPVRSMDLNPILEKLPVGTNNRSLVLAVEYGNFRMLLPGDAEKEAEAFLLDYGDRLRSIVMKAPHHGSKTSSTKDFLNRVRPDFIFIPCGYHNQFGHPHRSTVDRMAGLPEKPVIFRADEDGMVSVRTNGRNVRIESYQPGGVVK